MTMGANWHYPYTGYYPPQPYAQPYGGAYYPAAPIGWRMPAATSGPYAVYRSQPFRPVVQPQAPKPRPWYGTFAIEALKTGAIVGASVLGGLFGGVWIALAVGALTSGGISAVSQNATTGSVRWGLVAIDTVLGAIPGGVGSRLLQAGEKIAGKALFKHGIAKGSEQAIKRAALIGATDGALLGYTGGGMHSAYDSYQKTGHINAGKANRDGLRGILAGLLGGAVAGGALTALGKHLQTASSLKEIPDSPPDSPLEGSTLSRKGGDNPLVIAAEMPPLSLGESRSPLVPTLSRTLSFIGQSRSQTEPHDSVILALGRIKTSPSNLPGDTVAANGRATLIIDTALNTQNRAPLHSAEVPTTPAAPLIVPSPPALPLPPVRSVFDVLSSGVLPSEPPGAGIPRTLQGGPPVIPQPATMGVDAPRVPELANAFSAPREKTPPLPPVQTPQVGSRSFVRPAPPPLFGESWPSIALNQQGFQDCYLLANLKAIFSHPQVAHIMNRIEIQDTALHGEPAYRVLFPAVDEATGVRKSVIIPDAHVGQKVYLKGLPEHELMERQATLRAAGLSDAELAEQLSQLDRAYDGRMAVSSNAKGVQLLERAYVEMMKTYHPTESLDTGHALDTMQRMFGDQCATMDMTKHATGAQQSYMWLDPKRGDMQGVLDAATHGDYAAQFRLMADREKAHPFIMTARPLTRPPAAQYRRANAEAHGVRIGAHEFKGDHIYALTEYRAHPIDPRQDQVRLVDPYDTARSVVLPLADVIEAFTINGVRIQE